MEKCNEDDVVFDLFESLVASSAWKKIHPRTRVFKKDDQEIYVLQSFDGNMSFERIGEGVLRLITTEDKWRELEVIKTYLKESGSLIMITSYEYDFLFCGGKAMSVIESLIERCPDIRIFYIGDREFWNSEMDVQWQISSHYPFGDLELYFLNYTEGLWKLIKRKVSTLLSENQLVEEVVPFHSEKDIEEYMKKVSHHRDRELNASSLMHDYLKQRYLFEISEVNGWTEIDNGYGIIALQCFYYETKGLPHQYYLHYRCRDKEVRFPIGNKLDFDEGILPNWLLKELNALNQKERMARRLSAN